MYLLILLLLFVLTVAVLYLPYLHWYRWRGAWRLLGLLPPLPLLGYAGYAVLGMFAEPPDRHLEPEVAIGMLATSLAIEGLLRWWHARRSPGDGGA